MNPVKRMGSSIGLQGFSRLLRWLRSRTAPRSGESYFADAMTPTNSCTTALHVCSFACQFTGKERDTESGNDYFGARYYASTMGRFLSPDWSAKVMPVPYAKLDNPQSLNLYAYVGNNPLSRIDRDGHYTCADSAKCDSKNDKAFQGRLDALAKAQQGLKAGSAGYKQIGAILKSYGAAGEKGTANGKTVSVDFTNKSDGGLTSQTAKATITVNFNSNFSQQTQGNAAGLDGRVAHEGQHVVDGAPRGEARLPSEIAAEKASQAAFEGLSSQGIDGMDSNSYISRGWSTLWQPSWSDPALGFVRDANAMVEGIHDYQDDLARDHQ